MNKKVHTLTKTQKFFVVFYVCAICINIYQNTLFYCATCLDEMQFGLYNGSIVRGQELSKIKSRKEFKTWKTYQQH